MKGSMGWSLAVALALTAGVAGAQAPGDGPGFGDHRPPMEKAMGPHGDHGRWWNNPKLIEKLKLTDEQRKAMDDILQQHREKLIDLRAAVDKAELEMEPMVRADQPNESAVLAQIDKVAQARAELEKANARFLFALRAKLTPDQWKQVQDFRNNLGGHEGMRHDRSPGDRRPGGGDRHAAPPPPPPGPQGMLQGGPDMPAGAGANQ